MEQTKYTVFFTHKNSQADGFLMRDGLQECIDFAAAGKDFALVAWAPTVPCAFGGEKHSAELRAESIAAGRTIELIDGNYVPRGVQEDKPKEGEDFPRTLSDFLCRARMIPPFSVRVGATERQHPRLTWADTKPADRWEGYTVKSNPGPQSEQTKGPLSLSTNTNVVQLPAVCGSGHIALSKVK